MDNIKILDSKLFNRFINMLQEEATYDKTVGGLYSPQGISNLYMSGGYPRGPPRFFFKGSDNVEVEVLDITRLDSHYEFINFINKKRSERDTIGGRSNKNGGKKRKIKTRKGKSKKTKKTKKTKKSRKTKKSTRRKR